MIRPVVAASLAALLLAACSQGGGTSASSDPNAGLDKEILTWRTSIEALHPACAKKVEGHGCESFEVTCKALQEITPDETAKGVTNQVIAAMTFTGRGGGGTAGSSFALFSKTKAGWARTEAMPVNLRTCAPL